MHRSTFYCGSVQFSSSHTNVIKEVIPLKLAWTKVACHCRKKFNTKITYKQNMENNSYIFNVQEYRYIPFDALSVIYNSKIIKCVYS